MFSFKEQNPLDDELVETLSSVKLVIPMDNQEEEESGNCNIILNTTFTHILKDIKFDNLPEEATIQVFKDGRPFSYLIEKWLEENYQLIHIPGCKPF